MYILRSLSPLLRHPRYTLCLAVIALLLTAPSLFGGFATDDHNLRAIFQGYPGIPEMEQAPWDCFRLQNSEDAAVRQERIERGFLPWWTGEHLRTHFMRPLSSCSHWLDATLFGDHAWPMHLHSMLLFALLAVLVARLYRSVMPLGVAAALAALIYVIDDARALPAGWLSGRNALYTTIFGVLVLLFHRHYRAEGRVWALGAALVCLVAGLLSGEAAISVGAYLFAFALFLDRGTLVTRFAALLPYGAVVIVWRVVYDAMHFGVKASGGYVDPAESPLGFSFRFAERLPVLLFGAFGLPDSSLYHFTPAPWRYLHLTIAVLFVGAVIWGLWRALRHDPTARFWFTGMVLSTAPACMTMPQDRMLMYPSLGAAALIAMILAPRVAPDAAAPARALPRGARWLPTFWTGSHLILAPLLLLVGSYGIALVDKTFVRASESLPMEASVEEETVVLLHTLSDLMGAGMPICRASLRQPVPKQTLILSAGRQAVDIERTDSRTLVIRPEGGFLIPVWAELFRDPKRDPFSVGDALSLNGLAIEVLEVNADGRPTAVQFRFAKDLETMSYHWFAWTGKTHERVTLPTVGTHLKLPKPPLF